MKHPAIFALLFAILHGLTAIYAQEEQQPRRRQPNTRVNETLIDYGRTRQKAEESVLSQARQKAFDGDYELKSISINGREDDYYCVIQIEHEIYRPQNRQPIQ